MGESVLLVTGASSGIGRALALRAARAGYAVVGIGRDRAALDAVAERVRAEGGRIIVASYDVSDPTNAPAIVGLAREAFGRIDVLMNNAGHVAVGSVSTQSDDALRAQFGVHVIGPLALVREALPLLRASRGHVFMLGSGVARVPIGGLGAYPAAKAATRSATAILRRELKPDGIAVTYVDPGAVDTAFMVRAGLPGAPASILATPEDVARKIVLAIRTRPRVLNAVPWQTMFVALAEFFPRATDFVLERNPALVGIQEPPSPALPTAEASQAPAISAAPDEAEAALHTPAPAPAATNDNGTSAHPASFDDALEPVRRRMERVRLSESFVRGLLRAGDVLDANEVALRWAGMPNKNERAATVEVLDTLADAGFLAHDGEHYRVVRGPD
ncbi:MAG: SDR family NAD(P)-dependent oxidoreductase [Candidatus Eremiobacteraeota bacterium]|nr:SDR family NAD(P)-dependent oxidoreductase [Candidatus Eremiobacteraeota bacterium]MBV9408270.1 SDR family NAD(P)-dependent oxidoreductase [Candidatus Eremiobacteraeota bacterium]